MAVTPRATVVHRIRLIGELHIFRFRTKTALPVAGSAVFLSVLGAVEKSELAKIEKNFSTFAAATALAEPVSGAFVTENQATGAAAAMYLKALVAAQLKRICRFAGELGSEFGAVPGWPLIPILSSEVRWSKTRALCKSTYIARPIRQSAAYKTGTPHARAQYQDTAFATGAGSCQRQRARAAPMLRLSSPSGGRRRRRLRGSVRIFPTAWHTATAPQAAWPPRCGRCASASGPPLPGPRIRTSRQFPRGRCL